jgi:hypothetical protein
MYWYSAMEVSFSMKPDQLKTAVARATPGGTQTTASVRLVENLKK